MEEVKGTNFPPVKRKYAKGIRTIDKDAIDIKKFYRRMASLTLLHESDVEAVIDALRIVLVENLKKDQSVEIPHICQFSTRKYPSKFIVGIDGNPVQTQESVTVKAKILGYLRTSVKKEHRRLKAKEK